MFDFCVVDFVPLVLALLALAFFSTFSSPAVFVLFTALLAEVLAVVVLFVSLEEVFERQVNVLVDKETK